ncbi:MAG: hypothetical protein U9Q29_03650 [Campylobacterota bacterium]|nr:hypothetical protein [Campylobacterota bacterium]
MQRKNNILRSSRNGIAMIMAIAVIVILATIMALSLALTAQTTKRTTDIYLYEQSVLYSKSAAELALLKIAENGPCTTIAPYTLGGFYDINVSLKYVYKGLSCGGTDDYFTTITTDEQNGSVLMDIRVKTNVGTKPIRYFRRSIQKL